MSSATLDNVRDNLARADTLTTKLVMLLDAKPLIDPVAIELARVELAAAREVVAMEREKAAVERERAAMVRERQECRQSLHLFELKKAQLLPSPSASAPHASTPSLRSRTPPLHVRASMTPPPHTGACGSAEQLIGLDEDDASTAFAATAAAASFTSTLPSGDVQQFTANIVASLRAELIKQQITSQAAIVADADSHASTRPAVEVDVACRAVSSTLSALEGRLAHYRALEQRLTAAGDMEHVELNVGGERFHTTVATLCKEPSYLQGMFSGYVFESIAVAFCTLAGIHVVSVLVSWIVWIACHHVHAKVGRHFSVAPSADGSYFIDRSSKWFRCILDYLRNYQLSVDIFDLSKTERRELRAELEFYGLVSALEMFGTISVYAMFSIALHECISPCMQCFRLRCTNAYSCTCK
jgi:hypothetical protein